ncbi:MAG: ATP-binding protein, partial [Bryobacteraceae bacterium]
MSQSRNQFAGTLLLILTVAAAIAAVLSFQHLRTYTTPDDGVTWLDRASPNGQSRVVAVFLAPGGPGERAAIRRGDELVRIEDTPIHDALEVPEILAGLTLPGGAPAKYTLRRDGIEFQKDYIFLRAAPRDSALYYQYG